MSCSCHGTDGKSVQKSNPYDQCTMCARKHVKSAWSKYGEFCYEDDTRDYVSAQLRDAADHLKYDHKETALKCRQLAMEIEENREDRKEMSKALDDLRKEVLELFYLDHPEARSRLEMMRKN